MATKDEKKAPKMVTLNLGTITFQIEDSDDLNDIKIESLSGAIEDRLEMGLQAVGNGIKDVVGNGKLSFKIEVK